MALLNLSETALISCLWFLWRSPGWLHADMCKRFVTTAD